MYINAQKSKTMVVSREDNISVQVDHDWSKCTTLDSWDHTSQQMEIAQKKRRIALARQKAIVLASIWKDRNITRSSADADNALDAFSRQLRSTNMVPFRMLHIVSYCAIVTLSLRRLCFYDIRLQKIS